MSVSVSPADLFSYHHIDCTHPPEVPLDPPIPAFPKSHYSMSHNAHNSTDLRMGCDKATIPARDIMVCARVMVWIHVMVCVH